MKLSLSYKEYEIPEHDLKMKVKPLQAKDYQKVLGILAESGIMNASAGDANMEAVKQMSNPKILDVADNIFPKYVKEFEGLEVEDPDGTTREGTLKDLIKESGGLQIVILILLQLFTISNLAPQEKDIIKKPLPSISE